MESLYKYREKGCTEIGIRIRRALYRIGARIFKKESFRKAWLQCTAALERWDETEKQLYMELSREVVIEEWLDFFVEHYEKENKKVTGIEKLYDLGLTSPEAFLISRMASGLDRVGYREKAVVLYSRLAVHPKLTELEERELIETLEFFMDIKQYRLITEMGERILLDHPDQMRILYMTGEAFEQLGEIDTAKKIFQQMLDNGKKKMNGEEYRVLVHLCSMHLGNISINESEPLTALTYFVKAEAMGVDKKEAIRGKAIANYQSGDYEESIKAYDILEKEYDMKFISYYGKGVSYKAMEKMKEAKSWLLQAEELEPENQSVLYNLSHLEYLDENNEVALELIDRALETDPEDPDTLYGKAMVYTAMHRYVEAVKIFDEALKRKKESAEIYCRKADALRHLGRLDEAAYNYDIALQKNIGMTEAYYGKGMVLAAKGELAEALQVMDDTISVNQGFVEAYIGRSMIQMYFNDLEEGFEGETMKH